MALYAPRAWTAAGPAEISYDRAGCGRHGIGARSIQEPLGLHRSPALRQPCLLHRTAEHSSIVTGMVATGPDMVGALLACLNGFRLAADCCHTA